VNRIISRSAIAVSLPGSHPDIAVKNQTETAPMVSSAVALEKYPAEDSESPPPLRRSKELIRKS
jgi:hypothetical protein